ncbi:ATP-binding protein [Aquincola tertiaricarbonis]|uniref:ATP-binding protein n=1 Tax=Aquincola tertiaricarbonis TaxID=391953 RepID=UPI00069699E0|nr:ATP-binding protein [Aquincola tertiaricarbonis]
MTTQSRVSADTAPAQQPPPVAADALALLDASPDAAFDALVRQAARCSRSPVAALTLFTGQRSFTKAAVGMLRTEAAALHPLCAQVVRRDHAQVLRQLHDALPADAPGRATALALGIAAYAGVPVRMHGRAVGTLCVMGGPALVLDDPVLQGLHDLAIACGGLIESRLAALPGPAPAGPSEPADVRLQRAHELLTQTLDGLAGSVMISDPNGRILLANQRWHRQIGALLPRGCDHWPTAVRHLAAAGHYQQAIGREEAFVAWRLSLPAAVPRPQETQWRGGWVTINDRRLPDGTVVHLSMDITDRRRRASALAEEQDRARTSDARLRAVLRAVPDLWFVIADDGRFKHCSAPDHPSMAVPWSSLADRHMADLLPPPLADSLRAALRQARASGDSQRLEYELPVRGQPRSFEARISPMPDGELLYLVRDVTELRMLAAEVRLNEERWKFALDAAGHGVWDWEVDTGRTFYSAYWKQMLGYAEHEIGDDAVEWSSRVHPEDLPAVQAALQAYQQGEALGFEVDYRMRHRDGRMLWIRDRGRIVARGADGSALRMVGTQTDITRQRATEAALRDKQAAELASRSKSEFLSRMSHEMRTPLNAVIGFAQLLRLQGGARLDYVDHVLHASQHLLTLINDVLDLQQVEEGGLNLQPRAMDAAPLVVACASMLQPLAQARGVSQHLPPPLPAPPRLVADEQRLRQVLLNIGSNAIKYNRPAGHVHWHLEAESGGSVAIEVRDTGSGMTQDQQARLFQPFERLGREGNIEGSGLGLLIARRLVGDMGGSLSLSSQPGVGTVVRILLPAEPPAAPAAGTTAGVPGPAARTAPLRLLYLEDNRVNALLFTEALRMHSDVEPHVVETGAELFERLDELRPDVLVLDAHLPDCNGYEVLARLRTLPGYAAVPAYMCSADAAPEDMARAQQAGFAGYWSKPLDLSRILADLGRLGAGIH